MRALPVQDRGHPGVRSKANQVTEDKEQHSQQRGRRTPSPYESKHQSRRS
jgi:hypothetical protein